MYEVAGEPYFFDEDERHDYYPTMYWLWKFPDFLERVVIQPNVLRFLLRGAGESVCVCVCMWVVFVLFGHLHVKRHSRVSLTCHPLRCSHPLIDSVLR